MLSPIILAQLNQQHLADLRRDAEHEVLVQAALTAQPKPSARLWPRLPRPSWPEFAGLRRRHVAL